MQNESSFQDHRKTLATIRRAFSVFERDTMPYDMMRYRKELGYKNTFAYTQGAKHGVMTFVASFVAGMLVALAMTFVFNEEFIVSLILAAGMMTSFFFWAVSAHIQSARTTKFQDTYFPARHAIRHNVFVDNIPKPKDPYKVFEPVILQLKTMSLDAAQAFEYALNKIQADDDGTTQAALARQSAMYDLQKHADQLAHWPIMNHTERTDILTIINGSQKLQTKSA